ncbi:uncharacterized protein CDAR_382441 [Caerostris darwini]|uniref:Uncharacterized protein n=1 Tax=Caerostris darwini TaxID=1538125 RepID=A0AAV4SCG8_9ARAC|nr:uncharacterized protein CDAR_382441 [Caerostris darwini]
MQDGSSPHFAHKVKMFLLSTFVENRLTSRDNKFKWPSPSPDLSPADILLRGYLKFRLYRDSPETLAELKDVIRQSVGGINADMLHSVVIGGMTRLTCLILCSGHIEYLLF